MATRGSFLRHAGSAGVQTGCVQAHPASSPPARTARCDALTERPRRLQHAGAASPPFSTTSHILCYTTSAPLWFLPPASHLRSLRGRKAPDVHVRHARRHQAPESLRAERPCPVPEDVVLVPARHASLHRTDMYSQRRPCQAARHLTSLEAPEASQGAARRRALLRALHIRRIYSRRMSYWYTPDTHVGSM